MRAHPTFTTDDPQLASLALTLGGRLVQQIVDSDGRLRFEFTGVSEDLAQQVLGGDPITVDARAFLQNLDQVQKLIRRHLRARDGGRR